MKKFFIYILILIPFQFQAELKVKTYYVQVDNGYEILVHNQEFCPVTINVKFELKNLKSSIEKDKSIVIPADTAGFNLCNLIISDPDKEYSFSYNVAANYGDHLNKTFDKDFEYYLPFEKGASFVIGQGYNGNFSHMGEFSLDFEMDEGTSVHAAREGVVCKVVEDNTRSCMHNECASYNNYILIYHDDGTFAEYSHLKKDGAIVKEGDKVSQGDRIGYSGNTGWSSGPHLHFMVYQASMHSRKTLETKFLVDDGQKTAILQEHHRYSRDY